MIWPMPRVPWEIDLMTDFDLDAHNDVTEVRIHSVCPVRVYNARYVLGHLHLI